MVMQKEIKASIVMIVGFLPLNNFNFLLDCEVDDVCIQGDEDDNLE